ncbi:MAG: hypothetical protein K1X66_02730 [Verrucomicrobiae bacterium]|nr:hypothetical protein [Verrucomicrobiae bacterium]
MATPVSLAVFFAVPHEAALLKKKLKFRWQKKGVGLFFAETRVRDKTILFACLGMGKEAVKKNLTFLLDYFTFSQAILAGYAGALDPKLEKGDIVISDKRYLDLLPDLKLGKIISVDTVAATAEEKYALFQKTGASVCDMEYEAALVICQKHNLTLYSIRAVSDTAHENLPSGALASAFDLKRQRSTPLKIFCYGIRHPRNMISFFKFVHGLAKSQRALTQILIQILKNQS